MKESELAVFKALAVGRFVAWSTTRSTGARRP